MKPEPKDFLKVIIHAYCVDCLSKPDRKPETCKGCPVDRCITLIVGGER